MKLAGLTTGSVTRQCGSGDSSFSLKLRVPSYEDRISDVALELSSLQDSANAASHLEFRLKFVEDWSGVEDESGPVKYSEEAMKKAIAANPDFAYLVVAGLRKHFQSRLSEAAAKN